jgi:hypothetical protein
MKTNRYCAAGFASLIMVTIFSCHSSNDTGKKDTVTTAATTITQTVQKQSRVEDSILLTNLVKTLYKWHVTQKLTFEGFKPVKLNPTDTLYKGIDLFENQKSVDELRGTGLFADSFLKDYRNIALRMDKELRDGSSLWPDGELPTFNEDVDPWCNCQDSPIDNYWTIIKLTNIQINNNEAQFNWEWDSNTKSHPYKMRAVNENGSWKISYMQGYDMKAYSWEFVKK